MQVVVHGSTLSAATAATALSMVGHRVHWWPHPDTPFERLEESEWLNSEPGLKAQLDQARAQGSLTICDKQSGLPRANIYWLALDPDKHDYARDWVQTVLAKEKGEFVIVNNSTFPIGYTETLSNLFTRPGQACVALPDMLEEGRAMAMFTRPTRILLGSDDEFAIKQIRELLRAFNRREDSFQLMPCKAAEFTKLAIIGMLATRISYMNELASLADTMNVDVEVVRRGMGADPRIGHQYLYPGCGFGGPNFAQHLTRLSEIQAEKGRDSQLMQQVLDINEHKKETLFRKLWQHYEGQLAGKTVAIWGASFKPHTASIDNAPSIALMQALFAQGVKVQVHDPMALPRLKEFFGDHPLLTLANSAYEACDGAEALLLVTEWKGYWNPEWQRLSTLLKTPLILDGRNIYDPAYVADKGFIYRGIGRRADPR
ncbi:nucleotide sugar dehydrogenase [Larsenimonas suaedae]|uniref:UDP-glucose 6-dehydrogenase n=1 Tax=Larsenimonas suaedae TaxID=1851019 RepID=A0ABU1GW64_9GAMM|nr:nucleotide sugar dehydrogenase [Larsenimonas suaedae]MCM2971354.1 nucleotide sugar dehydrogenase [Larsenimonas suaedae]MDR5896065.1 nucleotide sugar dehydrogenase [Larsenimonas suaedae]